MSADPRQEPTGTVIADESPEGGGELGSLLRAPSSRARAAEATALLGRIVAVESEGAVSVEIPGMAGARAARLAIRLSQEELRAAAETGGSAVLVFENGDPALPIVVGLVRAVGAAHPSQALAGAPAVAGSAAPDQPPAEERSPASRIPQTLAADIDGRRVRITAQDEIVLECGSASITLRRNGRVVVRGTYIESYSDGTNRIKGGQVRIN